MLAGAAVKRGKPRQMRQLHLCTAGVLCLAQSPGSQAAGTATVQAKYQGV